ncbi:protein phosphatase 2C domain-containing protein [Paludicola sp. MB14-C6]|uniref:PP2C family protein-serine/threonine phosphatase n=1 Tax=Paludihabitans sp. MB14-C6 TaxID=3070656 RepID=UPI0027DB5CFA|nr:protein phosphatase 2C domain-containing protein [Paludicola sp. MB14-C6]WMJ22754.1 protein phosphatase 2C domain-containing protein [Paludicola sp. MB14-C6]
MNITANSYTNTGGRSNNEDYCCYNITNAQSQFILCDGLGGHHDGEIASKLVCDYLLNESKNDCSYDENTLLEMMNNANIMLKQQQRHKKMCTTVVAAFIDHYDFRYFHVGDSRLYYFKNGCLYHQSKDHSVSQVAATIGEIKYEDIRFHEDRNKLLKVLGNDDDLNIKKLEYPISIENNDAFLLCSDGFWEYVYEAEMEADLVKSISPNHWLSYMIKRILLKQLKDNDNFTAIAVFVNE